MATGIVIWILIAIFAGMIGMAVYSTGFEKGYMYGMRKEATGWLDALKSMTAPNWQSLPLQPEPDQKIAPEAVKVANQIFVMAYTLALDRVKKDIGNARIDVLFKEMEKFRKELENV